MDTFAGKLGVVTGGGSGMGRELVCQLAAEGCNVATCDLRPDGVAETAAKAQALAPPGTSVTSHVCDVSDESQVLRFRAEVLDQHATDHVDLVFNNAGISGGGSFITDSREEWERTFAVDWWGVYYCTRAFLPLLIRSADATLVNTSSAAGFWAALAPSIPNTAYSTAKFAVKGFSEALIEDLRANAPHVKVAVVMPGVIGTGIVDNSLRAHGQPLMTPLSDFFRENARTSAASAATIILDGVRAGKWRILVGEDAVELDAKVRADPEGAYDPSFVATAMPFPGGDTAPAP
jgi:NAD(P)-dependent dehydrogenase (short-subunit alcohol dehydrogenase family)